MITPVLQKHLSPSDVDEVRALVERVQAADATPPLSDHVMLHLPGGGDADVRHLLVRSPQGELVGYAHLDVTDRVAGSSAELAVLPEARGHGLGRALVEGLLAESPDGRLRLWAHGDLPAAEKLANALGFTRLRSLWQMRAPLSAPLPDVKLPEGIEVRTFVVGQDEQAWTDLNNRAFADHPDQGNWSLREVEVREAEPWFDAAGFFLACRGEELVGFHWTKVHGDPASHLRHTHSHSPGDETEHPHEHEALGEVYVVGVDPSMQGKRLGPALTVLGLKHLQDKGLREALLYVDEENTNAIRVYERLGFSRTSTDVCFHRQLT
ncbi:MAG: mycothiol synthase [Frankiales bacterium]|nr:mycothiol synthase [Frankiales bacterium]